MAATNTTGDTGTRLAHTTRPASRFSMAATSLPHSTEHFAWIAYQSLTGAGLDARSESGFRVGVKYLNEEWDVQAYLALRRAGAMSLGSWLRSLRGVEARALGAWDDPLPIVVGFLRLLRKLGSGAWSAARRLIER